jgi:hypothetical protein
LATRSLSQKRDCKEEERGRGGERKRMREDGQITGTKVLQNLKLVVVLQNLEVKMRYRASKPQISGTKVLQNFKLVVPRY